MNTPRLLLVVLLLAAPGATAAPGELSILETGARGDGVTVNTAAIQSGIDRLAQAGGGTLVVPEGVFVSGALFLKPGVHLELRTGGVLRCASDLTNFPPRRTRIEGHFEPAFNPALLNADGCDGLRISGGGTLDGAGRPVWDLFWARRSAAKDKAGFRNLDIARARLCLIENSRGVTIEGITFRDSQFWNLHLYNCSSVTVANARFLVPDDYKQVPSSDGIDVDSCQDVAIRRCLFSVTDDCIALKGTKGPFALSDTNSRPTERIRVSACTFRRGHGAVTFGSEATVVRQVLVESNTVSGAMPLLRLKLRPDTPQRYSDVTVRDSALTGGGAVVFEIRKWSQYFDLMGQPEPASSVRDLRVSGLTGAIASLGVVEGNAQTEISGIVLEDVDVKALRPTWKLDERVRDVTVRNVKLNGTPFRP